MKSFPQISRFLISFPILFFVPMLHSKGWICSQWEFQFKICSKFEELCWCVVCFKNCQSNQHSFLSRKVKSGAQSVQISTCVISVDTQLQISSCSPVSLIILNISLQMREKTKKTNVESSQQVLHKDSRSWNVGPILKTQDQGGVNDSPSWEVCPSLSLWLGKALVTPGTTPSFISLGCLGLLSQLQEWVILFLLGSGLASWSRMSAQTLIHSLG